MGSFFSTMFTPPPADDPNSAVVAAHSKAAYDQHWEAAKSSGKLVSWPLLLFPLLLLVPPPRPVLGVLDLTGLGRLAWRRRW